MLGFFAGYTGERALFPRVASVRTKRAHVRHSSHPSSARHQAPAIVMSATQSAPPSPPTSCPSSAPGLDCNFSEMTAKRGRSDWNDSSDDEDSSILCVCCRGPAVKRERMASGAIRPVCKSCPTPRFYLARRKESTVRANPKQLRKRLDLVDLQGSSDFALPPSGKFVLGVMKLEL